VLGSDLKQATAHYIQFGFYEGRATSGFDSVAYLLSNSDLAGRTASQALDHWLAAGADEGRDGDGAFGLEQASHALNGSSTLGSLETSGDRDWFELRATAGQRITIDLAASGANVGAGSLANGSLGIFNAVGQRIAFDDDSGPGLDARVTFSATATGVYYVVVGSEVGSVGAYRVLTAMAAELSWGKDKAPEEWGSGPAQVDLWTAGQDDPINLGAHWPDPFLSALGAA